MDALWFATSPRFCIMSEQANLEQIDSMSKKSKVYKVGKFSRILMILQTLVVVV